MNAHERQTAIDRYGVTNLNGLADWAATQFKQPPTTNADKLGKKLEASSVRVSVLGNIACFFFQRPAHMGETSTVDYTDQKHLFK